jgi:hypothetical protein
MPFMALSLAMIESIWTSAVGVSMPKVSLIRSIDSPFASSLRTVSSRSETHFAAQSDHYVDAGDLVSIWRHGSFADDHIGPGNIHKLMPILGVEVLMFGSICVKIRF